MQDTRVLYKRCIGDYESAGYLPRLIFRDYRQPCDFCGRPGWEFVLTP